MLTWIFSVAGCPLRIQWGRPRPLGGIDRAQASRIGRELQRQNLQSTDGGEGAEAQDSSSGATGQQQVDLESLIVPPPTDDTVEKYPSQVAA